MNIASRRLAEGGRIDRDQALEFTFDGRRLNGFAGDTLASALLANGIDRVGRSFKYHRPRGILSAGVEEPNALVTVGQGGRREPNLPATVLELSPGLAAESQNRWPSLAFDLQAINGLFAPFLASGFYYKTFMGPTRRSWMFYERHIRRAAGLGRAGMDADPDAYEVRHAFADVAVIGTGPAGLSAARAAAHAGARVVLIEQDFLAGGQLLAERTDHPASDWLARVDAELTGLGSVKRMLRTTAFGLYDGRVLGLVTRHKCDAGGGGTMRQSLTLLRAGAIVLATGAIERPLVCPGNDRPGVMLASAVRAYLNRHAVLPGRRVLIATTNDSAWQTAFDLAAVGAHVTLADARPDPSALLLARAERLGVAVRTETRLAGLSGRRAVKAARLVGSTSQETLDCDLVGLSGGWSPTVHLSSHLGIRPVYRAECDAFVPGDLPDGLYAAGAIEGTGGCASAIAAGHRAGVDAAGFCGKSASVPAPHAFEDAGPHGRVARAVPVGGRGKAFVDFQMDVTSADIEQAHREGYESVEHLKRYTTLGMGTDQGKTSNFAALAAMADLRGTPIPRVGTTTFRPPYAPVTLGALAGRAVGRHYKPVRRTPMHDWHLEHGADMVEVGLWLRPWFYRAAGSDADTAYVAEMRVVRAAAGLMDISTLGKIDVRGPDAAVFLDRVYANAFLRLPVGRARYGVMLRDDGIVFDDGTTTRLGEQHYFMTTSTARAADVQSRLEFLLDAVWPDLRVAVTSVTDEWAAMSLAGPHSRAILAAAFPGLDVSDAALPHLGVLESEFGEHPLRILRLSYSGERAYEIYAAASLGEAVWRRLLEVGEPQGLKPYGTEALGALRIEKGHVAGPEIDGRTTLDDLGMGRMVARRAGFVGDVLRRRPALCAPGRPRLVGLVCVEPGQRFSGGAIVFACDESHQGHGRGRITSTTWSPTLNCQVGLALLGGPDIAEETEVVAVHAVKGETVRLRVVAPVFLDPEGERLHG